MKTGTYGDVTIDAEIATMMDSIVYDYSSSLNGFSVFITDSFNLASINSIIIGENKLKNITFGITINVSGSIENPSDPFQVESTSSAAAFPRAGAGYNLSIFAGFSLSKRFDLLFSFSYISESMSKYAIDALVQLFGSNFAGFEISTYSGGVKLRYTLISKNVSKSTGFAGLTISPGFFFSYIPLNYSKTGINASSSYDTGIPVPPATAGADTGTFTINDLNVNSSIYIIVLDIEITFYLKLFKILNFYVGAGGSLSFSHFIIDATLDCDNEVNGASNGGYLKISGTEYGSGLLVRTFGGFELNLYVLISLQGTISWSNGQPLYGATFAFRFAF